MNVPVYILIRAWNVKEYFDRCINSVLSQRYPNYTIIYIDDASTYSSAFVKYMRGRLRGQTFVINANRKYATQNAYEAIHGYVKEQDAIIINLDGDDWLIRNDAVQLIVETYSSTKCDFTYGNCIIYNPGSPHHGKLINEVEADSNIRYSALVEKLSIFRREVFLPRHLRTWKAEVFRQIPKSYFQYPDGRWIRTCEDEVIFFALLEMSGKYEVLPLPLSVYNLENPRSDEKIHLTRRLQDEVYIRKQKPLHYE